MLHEDAVRKAADRLGRPVGEVEELWELVAHQRDLYDRLVGIIERRKSDAVSGMTRVNEAYELWRFQGRVAAFEDIVHQLSECYNVVEKLKGAE